jgi:hypothetical protein
MRKKDQRAAGAHGSKVGRPKGQDRSQANPGEVERSQDKGPSATTREPGARVERSDEASFKDLLLSISGDPNEASGSNLRLNGSQSPFASAMFVQGVELSL